MKFLLLNTGIGCKRRDDIGKNKYLIADIWVDDHICFYMAINSGYLQLRLAIFVMYDRLLIYVICK